MAILSLPTLSKSNATTASFSLVPNTQTFESPLNKSVQTYELPGARWHYTATWENLFDDDYFKLKAFILKCRGQAGRFYARDETHKTITGTASGTGTVDGATQVGNSIVSAWDTFEVHDTWLNIGDYITISDELKMVVDVIPLDVAGSATIVFEPKMRTSPANGAAIVISSPMAIFRLTSDDIDQASKRERVWSPVTITGAEVF